MITEFLEKRGLINSYLGRFYCKAVRPFVRKHKPQKGYRKMRKSVRKYGLKCIEAVYDICRKNNTPIWLEFGSMLGAYRDHGFIRYDLDIDMGMYAENLTPKIIRDFYNYGFTIKHVFKQIRNQDINNKIITEFSLVYKNLSIDIFLNFKDGDDRVLYSYNGSLGTENYYHKNILGVRRFVVPKAEIREIDFLGIKVGMPSNAKECLACYYGDDFMTPIKNWTRSTNDLDLPFEKAYGEMIGTW